MSEREKIKQVIDRLPDYKLAYIANLIFSMEDTHIKEVEPDEWDLKMIEDAQRPLLKFYGLIYITFYVIVEKMLYSLLRR